MIGHTSPVIQYFLSGQFLLALLISIAIIPIFRRLAISVGLVDHPGGRKKHKAIVPLIGGPAIFVSTAIVLLMWGIPDEFIGLASSVTGLFLIGMIDDRFDISAKFRLFVQTAIVIYGLWQDNVWVDNVVLSQEFVLSLGIFKYLVTGIAVLGVMNAINMLDGLDGLSSGVVLIILGFLIGISTVARQVPTTLLSVTIFGSVLGFWAYNYRFAWREKASVFMGDSGTMMLGFALPYLAIKLSIAAPALAPKSLLLWLFAIPIWDICAVIIKRVREGKSPLSAGRDHIHHVLMNAGLTVRHSLHVIYMLTIASIAFGVSVRYFELTHVEAYGAFAIFMVIYLGRVGSLSRSTSQAQVYDFMTYGDRRSSESDKNVIHLNDRSTLT